MPVTFPEVMEEEGVMGLPLSGELFTMKPESRKHACIVRV